MRYLRGMIGIVQLHAREASAETYEHSVKVAIKLQEIIPIYRGMQSNCILAPTAGRKLVDESMAIVQSVEEQIRHVPRSQEAAQQQNLRVISHVRFYIVPSITHHGVGLINGLGLAEAKINL